MADAFGSARLCEEMEKVNYKEAAAAYTFARRRKKQQKRQAIIPYYKYSLLASLIHLSFSLAIIQSSIITCNLCTFFVQQFLIIHKIFVHKPRGGCTFFFAVVVAVVIYMCVIMMAHMAALYTQRCTACIDILDCHLSSVLSRVLRQCNCIAWTWTHTHTHSIR